MSIYYLNFFTFLIALMTFIFIVYQFICKKKQKEIKKSQKILEKCGVARYRINSATLKYIKLKIRIGNTNRKYEALHYFKKYVFPINKDQNKINVIIGGFGMGKTTLLFRLISIIPQHYKVQYLTANSNELKSINTLYEIEKRNTVLFIDSLDELTSEDLENFIINDLPLLTLFARVIIACRPDSILDRLTCNNKIETSPLNQYNISTFHLSQPSRIQAIIYFVRSFRINSFRTIWPIFINSNLFNLINRPILLSFICDVGQVNIDFRNTYTIYNSYLIAWMKKCYSTSIDDKFIDSLFKVGAEIVQSMVSNKSNPNLLINKSKIVSICKEQYGHEFLLENVLKSLLLEQHTKSDFEFHHTSFFEFFLCVQTIKNKQPIDNNYCNTYSLYKQFIYHSTIDHLIFSLGDSGIKFYSEKLGDHGISYYVKKELLGDELHFKSIKTVKREEILSLLFLFEEKYDDLRLINYVYQLTSLENILILHIRYSPMLYILIYSFILSTQKKSTILCNILNEKCTSTQITFLESKSFWIIEYFENKLPPKLGPRLSNPEFMYNDILRFNIEGLIGKSGLIRESNSKSIIKIESFLENISKDEIHKMFQYVEECELITKNLTKRNIEFNKF